MEAAVYAEHYSNHPISRSLREAYGRPVDAARISDVEEIGGHGVTARVDGRQVGLHFGHRVDANLGELTARINHA